MNEANLRSWKWWLSVATLILTLVFSCGCLNFLIPHNIEVVGLLFIVASALIGIPLGILRSRRDRQRRTVIAEAAERLGLHPPSSDALKPAKPANGTHSTPSIPATVVTAANAGAPDLQGFLAGVGGWAVHLAEGVHHGCRYRTGDMRMAMDKKTLEKRDDSDAFTYDLSFGFLPLAETRFPRLYIHPENATDKMLHAVGMEDIGFESAEFSARFRVVSDNRKFAYAVITPRVMELLLTQPTHSLVVYGGGIVVLQGERLWPVDDFDPAAKLCIQFAKMIPKHVWESFHLHGKAEVEAHDAAAAAAHMVVSARQTKAISKVVLVFLVLVAAFVLLCGGWIVFVQIFGNPWPPPTQTVPLRSPQPTVAPAPPR